MGRSEKKERDTEGRRDRVERERHPERQGKKGWGGRGKRERYVWESKSTVWFRVQRLSRADPSHHLLRLQALHLR